MTLFPRRIATALAAAALIASAVLVAPSALAATPTVATKAPAPAADPAAAATKDVTAHLFQWPWKSVADECRHVLGPAGYGAVQVSPPQAHVELKDQGYPWWQAYQPVSYSLQSRYGTPKEFAQMVDACHRAGVRVYVDAVLNHMSGQQTGGVGSDGSTFGKYDYPGLYSNGDFHHCGRNGNDWIANWNDRWEIQNCELLGLSDLATETEHVQATLAGYLNSLLTLGVDGFRFDAAKHIPAADLQAITARLDRPAYIYQEVLDGGPIQKSEYLPVGSVIEDRYGTQISRVFKTGSLSWLNMFGEAWGFSASDASVVYTDSHDTERDTSGGSVTYKDGALNDLATVFELAWPYGHPLVLSSYHFTSTDAGPISDAGGTVLPVACNAATSGVGGWLCQDRADATVGMVGFRNTTSGTSVTRWWSDGSDAIAFAREGAGYVVVNKESGSLTRTFDTGLAAGSYCNLVTGHVVGNHCTGPSVTVAADGSLATTVAGLSALVISKDARVSKPTAAPVAAVAFTAYASVDAGQRLVVVGSDPALGAWDPAKGLALSSAAYPVWRASAAIPSGTSFEYKYAKVSADGTVEWESRSNRTATVPADGALAFNDGWNAGATVDASVTLHATLDPGQTAYIVGGSPALGNWSPDAAIPLAAVGDGTYTGTVTLPGSTTIEYKYIRKDAAGNVTWESDPNRSVTTGSGGSLTLDDTWR
ncbi:carbohydrate-binding module family 20 domain-containing protein [Microbacterium sp. 22303]|uniref:carbohydrate-binding module family 20 domain-containing protein n=1 Tax=Microbacterium sp. 22303 TaxID=3453905 RepID=UPI003F86F8B7